ncbi:uncharacterized protein PODANS_1_4060 [Podospora anserina S mat+]|uniref:Podospora anserina S mat+ genomic DNA chromosome 1, supercontig 1 n=1 Tax=Podospora anserina (strain S / ATCC MYA-4624 / DSM 980 / FGSC 10383) TaxID=515849 RepID=B2AAH9_PODAN|nr:uncharacterized protein PODANS_1_4060 [Podospora anserina S mat+]CAP60091.1 unnamed protein product [Podospora anserina S mat+]CDP22732.1 Putative protein of unknown function [Podospora anserina S mat+]
MTSIREWKADEYQKSLGFVPKLATKVLEWLDLTRTRVQPDGILDIEIGRVLAQGEGKLLGLDRSPSMIRAARENFVFEMGGMGNIAEARAAMMGVVARTLKQAPENIREPWFFPDEEWVRDMMEVKVGGFEVERSEMEWRPTKIDGRGGLEGWVRLIGGKLFGLIRDEKEREEAVREVVRLLEIVCRREPARERGDVEYVVNYVRLRVVARRL